MRKYAIGCVYILIGLGCNNKPTQEPTAEFKKENETIEAAIKKDQVKEDSVLAHWQQKTQ